MNILIRQETPHDHKVVFSLTEQAFRGREYSNFDEQFMVKRLRKSKAFVPELSLVAEYRGKVVGHIMLTKAVIKAGTGQFPALGMVTLSVLPIFQRQRVGSMLIKEAHRIACMLRYDVVVVIGHAGYFPRFGYKKASALGIRFPYQVPDECCMVAELISGGLTGVNGTVELPNEFSVPKYHSVSL